MESRTHIVSVIGNIYGVLNLLSLKPFNDDAVERAWY